MQEIKGPLASLPDDPVPIAANVDFPMALRGYDRLAVDAYVRRTSQLVAELQATRSPDSAIRRALERVGEEVAGILQRAHETADRITEQSRSDAEDRLEVARREAAETTIAARNEAAAMTDAARNEAAAMTAAAENRLKELDAETDRIWAERHRIVEDTRQLAGKLLGLAETAVEQFPPAEEVGSRAQTDAAHTEPQSAAEPDDLATRPVPAIGDEQPYGDEDFADEEQFRDAEPVGGEEPLGGEEPVRGEEPLREEERFGGAGRVRDPESWQGPVQGEAPFGRPQTVGGQERFGGQEFGEPKVRRGESGREEGPLESPDDADATIVMPPVIPGEDPQERR